MKKQDGKSENWKKKYRSKNGKGTKSDRVVIEKSDRKELRVTECDRETEREGEGANEERIKEQDKREGNRKQ